MKFSWPCPVAGGGITRVSPLTASELFINYVFGKVGSHPRANERATLKAAGAALRLPTPRVSLTASARVVSGWVTSGFTPRGSGEGGEPGRSSPRSLGTEPETSCFRQGAGAETAAESSVQPLCRLPPSLRESAQALIRPVLGTGTGNPPERPPPRNAERLLSFAIEPLRACSADGSPSLRIPKGEGPPWGDPGRSPWLYYGWEEVRGCQRALP